LDKFPTINANVQHRSVDSLRSMDERHLKDFSLRNYPVVIHDWNDNEPRAVIVPYRRYLELQALAFGRSHFELVLEILFQAGINYRTSESDGMKYITVDSGGWVGGAVCIAFLMDNDELRWIKPVATNDEGGGVERTNQPIY
jgi:hypothetical protein